MVAEPPDKKIKLMKKLFFWIYFFSYYDIFYLWFITKHLVFCYNSINK